MTEREINIAIAEACGWKPTTDGGICWDCNGDPIVTPPDYCNDLNAMHEAEKVLTRGQQTNYCFMLMDIQDSGGGFARLHATARQRAETFLRTLGKWEEDI